MRPARSGGGGNDITIIGFADAFPCEDVVRRESPTLQFHSSLDLESGGYSSSFSAEPLIAVLPQQQYRSSNNNNSSQHPQRGPAPELFLAFCTGGPDSYGRGCHAWLNRFVAWRSQGMWHVESVFRWANGTLTAWHCTTEGPIECIQRDASTSYKTSRWTNFAAQFSDAERWAMYDFFCEQHHKRYNFRGLVCNFLPLLRWLLGTPEQGVKGTAWFCSELIMAALKYVRPAEFRPYHASRTNIRDLYNIMRAHSCFSPAITTMVDMTRYPLQWS